MECELLLIQCLKVVADSPGQVSLGILPTRRAESMFPAKYSQGPE